MADEALQCSQVISVSDKQELYMKQKWKFLASHRLQTSYGYIAGFLWF